MTALAWNAAGWLAMQAGNAICKIGCALCWWAGKFDARADNAGYWDRRTP